MNICIKRKHNSSHESNEKTMNKTTEYCRKFRSTHDYNLDKRSCILGFNLQNEEQNSNRIVNEYTKLFIDKID